MRRLVSVTLAEAAGDGAERLFVYLILYLLGSLTLCLMGKSYYILKYMCMIIHKKKKKNVNVCRSNMCVVFSREIPNKLCQIDLRKSFLFRS